MAQKTIQIADKQTLDAVKQALESIQILNVFECNGKIDVIYSQEKISEAPRSADIGSSMVAYRGELYIFDGTNTGYPNYNSTIYKWDGTSWVQAFIIGYPIHDSCVVVLNDEIHILGGYAWNNNTNYLSKHSVWNGYSVKTATTLPHKFSNGSAVVLNGEIHILGSYSGNTTGHYKWDGSSWTSVSTLPYNFYWGSAVVLNGEIHILGGYGGNKTEHYKWDGSSWTSVSTLPYEFYQQGGAVVLDGEIHILGGGGNKTAHYKWDGNKWSSVDTLPKSNKINAAVLNNEIHILDGTEHYKLNDAYMKISTTMKQNQKIFTAYPLDKINILTNCIKETNNLLVTEDGITEFKIKTADENIVLTVKG